MSAVIRAEGLSKWYGNVLGLSDVSLEIQPGIVGLLGPNGAGKSTLMKLLTGQLKPSLGRILIDGRPVWNSVEMFQRFGFCPEPDAFYEDMTGREFLSRLFRLSGDGPAEAEDRADRAMEAVDLARDKDRLIRGYSRGMRQRVKLAQALAHDPEILVLDEPLNGLDPLGKRKVIRLIKDYRSHGRTVLVSSHVLPEIEALTREIILIHQGKILAQGDIHAMRDLIEKQPLVVAVRCDRPRDLAARLVGEPAVIDVRFEGPDGLVMETRDRDRLFGLLPGLAVDGGLDIREITSPDDNLQAVFDYLVGK